MITIFCQSAAHNTDYDTTLYFERMCRRKLNLYRQ